MQVWLLYWQWHQVNLILRQQLLSLTLPAVSVTASGAGRIGIVDQIMIVHHIVAGNKLTTVPVGYLLL
jgi:hypothetical protein